MKKQIQWFVEHPFWTFVGAVLGIVGIFVTLANWIIKPVGPELEALETLLRDVNSAAIQVAEFASYSENQIENMLGRDSGWYTSISIAIDYTQRATENLINSQGFPNLTENGRQLFTRSNSRLDQYKNERYLKLRVAALKQHACGLVLNSTREIGILNGNTNVEECFPITLDCKNVIIGLAQRIGTNMGGC